MSTTTITFLNSWQTLIGSALGPFLAIMFSVIGFWIKTRIESSKELKENLRRIEIGITRGLNEAFIVQQQIAKTVQLVRGCAAEVEAVEDEKQYMLNIVNFPITGEIYRDPDTSLLKTRSYYLHNKLLITDSALKETNKVLDNLKKDFEALIRLNELISTKEQPNRQRQMYAQNLKSFADALECYSSKGIPNLIKLMMQVKNYNNKLRERHGATLKKYERTGWKIWKKKDIKKSITNLSAVDRIDEKLEFEIQEELKNALERIEDRAHNGSQGLDKNQNPC